MSSPFTLTIGGVGGGTANLLAVPSSPATTDPFVELDSFTASLSTEGGGSMSFAMIQPLTPSGGPWWASGTVNDNAVVKFFDTRYSGSTPLFLGFINTVSGQLLENGVGNRCEVSVDGANLWLSKTVVRKSYTGTDIFQTVGAFSQGSGTATTDHAHINQLLAKIHTQVNDATTRGILDTSIIGGSDRAIYSGTATPIGKLQFDVSDLRSALDQIAEEASGQSKVPMKYFIDPNGRLTYAPKDTSATYANAPMQISTLQAVPVVGGTAVATVVSANNLNVTLDHGRIVKGIFVAAADVRADRDANAVPITNAPYFRKYDGGTPYSGAGLPSRTGALPHEIFSASKLSGYGIGSRSNKIQRLTRATFQVRSKPVRSVSFEIVDSDLDQTASPDWTFGFSQGYAQTSGTAFKLVKAWLPDQYVKINAPSLDVNNEVLRIVDVGMSFQSGSSYSLKYSITADFAKREVGDDMRRIYGGR